MSEIDHSSRNAYNGPWSSNGMRKRPAPINRSMACHSMKPRLFSAIPWPLRSTTPTIPVANLGFSPLGCLIHPAVGHFAYRTRNENANNQCPTGD